MSAWQPIDSAPHDLSEFLAYDSLTGTMDVCYCTKAGELRQVQFDGEYGPNSDEFGGLGMQGVTHFMPLPAPPLPGDSNVRPLAGEEKVE